MGQVNVTINGRQFRMACEDGQETHLTELAADLDRRVADLRSKFGEIGDARLTVMAALTVADDLAESDRKLRKLESELATLRDTSAVASMRERQAQAQVAAALTTAAERIEAAARRLQQAPVPDNVPQG